jgi:electron transfer flavoprotein beta subunit
MRQPEEACMKIYVCIKQVPDTETKIEINNGTVKTQGIKWVMNPYDEFAVEEALKLKAQWSGSTVTAVSLGPKSRVVDSLRTALAMGADEAVVINAQEDIDSFVAAKALAKALKDLGDLGIVFTGKLAIDDNASAVSQMIAEHLEIPHATNVSKAEYTNEKVTVEKEVEGGSKEILELILPAVVAANKGLNTPRYASLPGIMKAKKKPITELELSSLGIEPTDQKVKFSAFQLPPERPGVRMLEGDSLEQVQQLVKLLREEAKVI